jgi:hypothetical protein
MSSGQWRHHPKLRGRFHPEHPDDLQVLVHEGGPRTAVSRPELMWVRIIGESEDAFLGTVLNTPEQLETIQAGSEVFFIMPDGFDHPVRATQQYLAERLRWKIHPCTQCGMSELFDPPSVLAAKVFPGVADVEMFSALCAICGGAQVVEALAGEAKLAGLAPKSWWRRLFSTSS